MCAWHLKGSLPSQTFLTLNFSPYRHPTPSHLQKNLCSTQNMRRKLRTSKRLLRCFCHSSRESSLQCNPLLFSHFSSCYVVTSKALISEHCVQSSTLTTVWWWSLLSALYFSQPFLKIHVYADTHTQTHTQAFTKQRLGKTSTLLTKQKKCHATSGRAQKNTLFLEDFTA